MPKSCATSGGGGCVGFLAMSGRKNLLAQGTWGAVWGADTAGGGDCPAADELQPPAAHIAISVTVTRFIPLASSCAMKLTGAAGG